MTNNQKSNMYIEGIIRRENPKEIVNKLFDNEKKLTIPSRHYWEDYFSERCLEEKTAILEEFDQFTIPIKSLQWIGNKLKDIAKYLDKSDSSKKLSMDFLNKSLGNLNDGDSFQTLRESSFYSMISRDSAALTYSLLEGLEECVKKTNISNTLLSKSNYLFTKIKELQDKSFCIAVGEDN